MIKTVLNIMSYIMSYVKTAFYKNLCNNYNKLLQQKKLKT